MLDATREVAFDAPWVGSHDGKSPDPGAPRWPSSNQYIENQKNT
jgi:hypothetical protein